jgi:hypothetical protein
MASAIVGMGNRGLHGVLLGVISGVILWGSLTSPVSAQGLQLPRGLSVANQLEYAWSRDTEEPTLENWTDVRYISGAFGAGIRMVSFQPPDPTISVSENHFDVDYRFVEASSENGTFRAGNYYALFGQGLALNSYLERDLRVDTNLEGAKLQGRLGDASFTFLTGNTVVGSSEDVERRRADWVHGADGEYNTFGALAPDLGTMFGGSAVRLQRHGDSPQNLLAARSSVSYSTLYLYGEYGHIDRPGETGSGLFASGTVSLGPFDLLAEYKDYDRFGLNNSAGKPYNLPPSLSRERTYTLLNRHPHALDPNDEVGFQVEGTLTASGQQLLGHFGQTRNQDDDDIFNTFDEAYGEITLHDEDFFGFPEITFVNAFDYQKSFLSGLTEDPYRELYTNIHELRVVGDDVNSYRVQFEHQHNQSEAEGEFDTYFMLLEYSRSPDWTFNLVGETSNKSSAQLAEDEKADAVYGLVSYHISDQHDVSVLYGRRAAGFVCVGGVCRFEPEFEGVEVRLLSRF